MGERGNNMGGFIHNIDEKATADFAEILNEGFGVPRYFLIKPM